MSSRFRARSIAWSVSPPWERETAVQIRASPPKVVPLRLDEYLVKTGLAPSRSRAKQLVKMGVVRVNGKPVTDPSRQVGDEEVEISDPVLADKPSGYFKLRRIIEETGVIEKKDVVLDLGSSSGGFALAASELASVVYGVEISPEFRDRLEEIQKKRGNIKITFDNVFTADPERVAPEPVDVILDDLTLDPVSSFRALERFLPRLKPGGRVLFVAKLGSRRKEDLEATVRGFSSLVGLELERILEGEKREIYAILRKPRAGKG